MMLQCVDECNIFVDSKLVFLLVTRPFYYENLLSKDNRKRVMFTGKLV